ncbi:MAG: gliding motility-associated C-terminal domain-containing protein [Bacteroidales bacterium]
MNTIRRLLNGFVFVIGLYICCNGILWAQSPAVATGQGCANVEIREIMGGDTVSFSALQRNNGLILSCDTSSRLLIPIGFAPGYPDPDSGYYTCEQITYDPPMQFFDATAVQQGKQFKITLPVDDCWGELFSFDYYFPTSIDSDTPAFKFFFYDESYNQVIANSNGVLHMFNSSSPLLAYAISKGKNLYQKPTNNDYIHCPYSPSAPFPDNRAFWGLEVNPTLNGISAPFCDIHYGNASGNQGFYISFIGEYPCRMCVLSIYDVPMFGNYNTSDTSRITSMIVLYETTNVIEFYLKRKPAYTSTNNSKSVLGIQNIDGTIATSIVNKKYKGTNQTQSYNNTVWEATNEAWRIKPVGELNKTYKWYKKNSLGAQAGVMQEIVANSQFQVIANPGEEEGATWYFCKMGVTRMEDGLEFDVWDSILVHPLDIPALTHSHNSADNQATVMMNVDSTALHDTICAGDRVIFRLSGGDSIYFVEPATLNGTKIVNGTVTVSQPADVDFVFYKFKVNNYKNGELVCTRYDSVYIHNRKVAINIGSDTVVCKGSPVVYKNLSQDSIGSYLWKFTGENDLSFNTSDVNFIPQKSGTLSLKFTDNRGCNAQDMAQITVVDYPQVNIEGQMEICSGTSTTLSVKSNIEDVNYLWNDGPGNDVITVSPMSTQDYSVTVKTNQASCSTTKTATVLVTPIPQIKMYDDRHICEQETALIGVKGDADRYVWSTEDVSVNQGTLTEYTVIPDKTTYYTVTAYNHPKLNCESSSTMTVFVEKKPIPVISFSPDFVDELTPVVVFTDNTEGIVDRRWDISDGATSTDKNFRHNFDIVDSIMTYYVTLVGITGYGCRDSLTTKISVVRDHHIWAPTGVYIHSVSQTNSQFRVIVDAVKDFNLKIFNRWGTIVFETNDVYEAWNCTYKGKFVEQGVYTWYASYHHLDTPDRLMQKTGAFMVYN